jgi:hypothetical protein
MSLALFFSERDSGPTVSNPPEGLFRSEPVGNGTPNFSARKSYRAAQMWMGSPISMIWEGGM